MKKVLSIVLSIAMVVCLAPTMAFAATTSAAQADAAYSDTEGKACEGAVNVLSALGVVDGFTDGTYKPEQTVTRAQMAKLIVAALGVSEYATAKNSSYTDMGSAQWAIPVVEYATNLGIINGVGNGKFAPNKTVTYEQVATMICRALGYTTASKEMNGTYPAVFVQKARALGILDDVQGYSIGTGANRGDCAIMLYNALELAQVYADADGVTQPKNGTDNGKFQGKDGTGYLTMMGTLNKGGYSTYDIVDEKDAEDSLTPIKTYIGAAAKLVYNKEGKVLSVSDIKTTFLTGDYDKDGKFDVDGTKYTIANKPYSVFTNAGAKNATDEVTSFAETSRENPGVTTFVNNAEGTAKIFTDADDGDTFTIACKISGKTITDIFSIASWSENDAKQISASQLKKITSDKSLLSYDFPLDDDTNVDESAFILSGVSKLSDIKEDNIVAVYADNADTKKGTITKVEVGTKVVTGKCTKVKTNSDPSKVEYTVDGNVYKFSKLKGSDIQSATKATEFGVGDDVTLYLDYDGKIYKAEATETNYSYGVILTAAKTDGFDADYKTKLFTSNGESTVYTFKNKSDGETAADIGVGTLVQYKLNSKNEITKINAPVADNKTTKTKYKNGVIGGKTVASNIAVFEYKGANNEEDKAKKDNYSVLAAKDLTDDSATEATYFVNSKSDMTAILVSSDSTASNDIYGVINSIYDTQNSSEDDVYQYVGLANGAEFDAITKDKIGTYAADTKALMYITKTGDEIKSVEAVTPNYKEEISDDKKLVSGKNVVVYGKDGVVGDAEFAGMVAYKVEKADSDKVKIKNVESKTTDDKLAYQVIKDAKVYVANLKSNKKFDKWTIGSTADISINGYVVLVQTDKDSNNWDTVLYISDKDAEDCVEAGLFSSDLTAAKARVAAAKASVRTVDEVTKTAGDVSATAAAIDSAVKAAVKTTTGVTVTTDAAKVYTADKAGTYPVTITITDKTTISVSDTVKVDVVVK